MENYQVELSQVDIAINPCFIPVPRASLSSRQSFFSRHPKISYNENPDDYVLRFKMPSNPGRIVIWGLLGIPVVSDFIPSAMQSIADGQSGFLACNTGGWYSALEQLILDDSLRQRCGDQLQQNMVEQFSFTNQNVAFLDFLSSKIMK
jgi:glycosyltransferase involved in cell wall biosynthesis